MDFWQLIFQDHLYFIYDALGKDELELIDVVRQLYNSYTGSESDMMAILELKKQILAKILNGQIDIKLDATFVNHMINEAEEALFGEDELLEDHKLWLLDAEGHELTIIKMLDPVEKELTKQLKHSMKKFKMLFSKTLEFIGYLRSRQNDFPALSALNTSAIRETDIYLELVTMIADKIERGEALATIKPIMLDHMLREQSYYLSKIGGQSEFGVDFTTRGVQIPDMI